MPDTQDQIYSLVGNSLDAARNPPHLESFTRNWIEVLFFTDAVDEFPPAIYGDDSWKTGEDWEVYVRWTPAADITSSRELATRWMLYIRENHPNLAIEFETNRDEWS